MNDAKNETVTAVSELKPCPFCGAPGVLVQVPAEFGPRYRVDCSRACESARLVGNAFAAIEAWNRRSALSPSPAPVTPVSELKPCPFCGASPLEDRIEPHEHSPMLMGLIPIPFSYPGAWSIECVPCGFRIFSHDSRDEAVSKWNRRSALADVGESAYNWGTPPFPNYPAETVDSMAEIGEAFMDALPNGYSWLQSPSEIIADLENQLHDAKQPRPAAEASLIDRVVRDLEQSGCSGTAQCIRENFRVQPVSPAAEAKCECGHAKMPGMTRCLNCNDLSPAAHTEQVTEEEREALDWAATQADEYANECDLLHYGHECAHARRARLLRRLAEQGSGAKEYKEGGT